MEIRRTTEQISFNTGISLAEYNESPAGETRGGLPDRLLPGATTVSEALAKVFPEGESVRGEIMRALVAGNSAFLRTPNGFARTARATLRVLREKKGPAAAGAVRELEGLLADTEVFEHYRAALLET